jgi:hypothetical protein
MKKFEMGKERPKTKTPAKTINGRRRPKGGKVSLLDEEFLEVELMGLPEYMELTNGHTIIDLVKLQT